MVDPNPRAQSHLPLESRTLLQSLLPLDKALIFLLLLLVVQLAAFAIIRTSIASNARASVQEQLQFGERVFARLIEQNASKLAQGARILASDYGFREAIGSDDRETIESALSNHSARIGATLSMFYGTDGAVKASTANTVSAQENLRVDQLVKAAARDGWSSGTAIIADHVFQAVVVPVKAPQVLGWVVMGFAVDQALASDMRALSALYVSFLSGEKQGNWTTIATTLDRTTSAALAAQRDLPIAAGSEVNLAGEDYGTLVVPVLSLGERRVVAVLQRSIGEAVAPYSRLQLTLVILTLIGMVVSAIGSVLTARRITRPVIQLAETAKRLGAGDYGQAVTVVRDDEVGDLARAFNQMRENIAEREGQIRRLAYWDTLTELPNRASFVERLVKAIATASAEKAECSVLMMDLDRFKHVNDVLGHSFGDALLRQVADRVQAALRNTDITVARLGGDEFAVLLPKGGPTQALATAEKLVAALREPITIERQAIDMGAGIGIASFPAQADSAETLLARAEVAMYVAKRKRNGPLTYDPSYDKGSQDNLSMIGELRRAVENDELVLFFQPKLSLQTGQPIGMEALVRWIHPTRGFMPPDRFIPFAEQTGYITEITQWVMRKSAEQCMRWQRDGLQLSIGVNLSTRDLMDQDLAQRFAHILDEYAVDPKQFCL